MATTITIDRQFVKTGETAELKFTFTNPNYSLSLASLTVRTEASTDTTIAGGTIHSPVNRGVIPPNHGGRHHAQPRQSWRHQRSACLSRPIHAYREPELFHLPHRLRCCRQRR